MSTDRTRSHAPQFENPIHEPKKPADVLDFKIQSQEDLDKAVELLSQRSPLFREMYKRAKQLGINFTYFPFIPCPVTLSDPLSMFNGDPIVSKILIPASDAISLGHELADALKRAELLAAYKAAGHNDVYRDTVSRTRR